MSLNARIGLLLLCAVVSSPFWLPLLPFLWFAARRSRRDGRALGLLVLTAAQARTLAAMAEATLPKAPTDGWATVARNIDRYLAAVDSPRRWRTLVLIVGLEWVPLLRLQRPLSRQTAARRRVFLERHLATTHGLMAIPSLCRQLIRMGYYTDGGVAQELGFRSMQKRQQAPRAALVAAAVARREVG
jgi:hypothetical protein